MTADIESAGAMVTAGLAAHEIDRAAGAAGTGHDGQPGACANCGTALAGSFCHACGQRGHVHRSLLHMSEEFLHGILHFDAKAWRTLPLLVARPGELTRRYIEGHRARFVSPLALFLFMVFFLFFVGSLTSKSNFTGKSPDEKGRAVAEQRLAEARARLEARQAALAARPGGADAADLAEVRSELAIVEQAARALDGGNGASAANAANAAEETSISGIAPLDAAFAFAMKNPEYALYKLKNTAYKFSFLLVPITLPFLWLMFFWRPGVTMFDHAVFSLYSLSFMSLLFVLLFLLKFAGLGSAVASLLFIVPPLHLFFQLRGTYGLTVGETLWRTAALVSVVGCVFVLYLMLILYLSMQ
jgi:hypothetical protein